MPMSAIFLSTLVPGICFLILAVAGYRWVKISPSNSAKTMAVTFCLAGLSNLSMVAMAASGANPGFAWYAAEYLSALMIVVGAICTLLLSKSAR